MQIQSSAVITRSYLLRYHIRHCDNNGRYYIYIYNESDIRLTTDTPYLALTGELWGVYCEDFGEN